MPFTAEKPRIWTPVSELSGNASLHQSGTAF